MSWESTAVYYRLINEGVRDRLGGLHSAPLLLWSADFDEVARLQAAGRWDDAGALLAGAGKALEAAGADLLAIATNTMHLVADTVARAVSVPLVNLVDVAAAAARAGGYSRVGLLGTAYTMTAPFYADRLARGGLEVLVPDADDRDRVHQVIFEELCRGVVDPRARADYLAVIDRLAARGAQAVLLACTEIGLLLGPDDGGVPLLDTTRLHVDALLAAALG